MPVLELALYLTGVATGGAAVVVGLAWNVVRTAQKGPAAK